MTLKVPCPTCKKEVEWHSTPSRPFCSARCKLLDLGEWAAGNFAIPTNHDAPASQETTENKNSDEDDEENS